MSRKYNLNDVLNLALFFIFLQKKVFSLSPFYFSSKMFFLIYFFVWGIYSQDELSCVPSSCEDLLFSSLTPQCCTKGTICGGQKNHNAPCELLKDNYCRKFNAVVSATNDVSYKTAMKEERFKPELKDRIFSSWLGYLWILVSLH
jgi:hypothetical protein